ncbi:MAG: hypothetical protein HYS58_00780 [Elusimicrobia bacterium]|nr:hypothetical protein [Elusimicrobiota bacterium]
MENFFAAQDTKAEKGGLTPGGDEVALSSFRNGFQDIRSRIQSSQNMEDLRKNYQEGMFQVMERLHLLNKPAPSDNPLWRSIQELSQKNVTEKSALAAGLLREKVLLKSRSVLGLFFHTAVYALGRVGKVFVLSTPLGWAFAAFELISLTKRLSGRGDRRFQNAKLLGKVRELFYKFRVHHQ